MEFLTWECGVALAGRTTTKFVSLTFFYCFYLSFLCGRKFVFVCLFAVAELD